MGLALSSFANLGVLARQRALVFPFLLLVVLSPRLPAPPEARPGAARASEQLDVAERECPVARAVARRGR